MTVFDFCLLAVMAGALVLGGIGICRTRLMGRRTTRAVWLYGYLAIKVYGLALPVYFAFAPYGPITEAEVAGHVVAVAALLVLVWVQRKAWHQPDHLDHAPPESDRAPLGDN